MPKKNTISTIFAELSTLMHQDNNKAQNTFISLTPDQKRQLFLFQDKSGSTLLHKAVTYYLDLAANPDSTSAAQAEAWLHFITTLTSSCTYTDNVLADKSGRTPTMLAAQAPNTKLFQALSAHIDYSHVDHNGHSLFMHLLHHHNQTIVAFLLDSIQEDLRASILHNPKKPNLVLYALACQCPHDTIAYLLAQGVPTGLNQDSEGNTALMLALQNYSVQDYPPIQDLLLAQAEDLRAHVNHQGSTLLHLAAKHGHVASCQLLLDLEIPIDELDHSGFHPIHYALSSKQQETFRLLLDHLDSPHLVILRSGCPMSLYHYALHTHNLKAVETLLQKPVTPTAIKHQSDDGVTFSTVQPFIMALQTHNIVATRLFLHYGSNPNCSITQDLSDCPWHSTAKTPGTLSVSPAISAKNSSTYGEIQDWTPLHEAACGGSVAKHMLTDLLQHGALATIPCAGNGITPLMLAVAFSDDDTTTLPTLLLDKSDLNARTYDGLTHALAVAISRHFYQVAGLLLDHGANPNLGCGSETPLSLAYRKKSPNTRFIAKLLRHGADSHQLVVDAFPSSVLDYIRTLTTLSSADLFTAPLTLDLQASIAQHFPDNYSKADIVLFLHALGEHAYQAHNLDLYRQSFLAYPLQITAVPFQHILRNWKDLASDYLLGLLVANTHFPIPNPCDHELYDPSFFHVSNPVWAKLLPDPFTGPDLSLCKKPPSISLEQGLYIAAHSTIKNLVHPDPSQHLQALLETQPDQTAGSNYQQAFLTMLAGNKDPDLVPALRYATVIHYWVWWRTKIMMQPRASSSLLSHYSWNSLLTLTLDSAALVQSFVTIQLTEKNDTSWPEADKALIPVLYRPDFFPDSATLAPSDLSQAIWLNFYDLLTEDIDLLCDSCEHSDVLLLIGCFFQILMHQARHKDSQCLVYLRDTMQALEDKKPELLDNRSLQQDFITTFTAVVQTCDTLNQAQQQAIADLTLRAVSYPDQLTKLSPLQLDTLTLLAKRYLVHKSHTTPHRSLIELLAVIHTHSRFLATDLTKRAHTHIIHTPTSTQQKIADLTHQLQALESTCRDQKKQLTAFTQSQTTISDLQNELRQRACEATLLSDEHQRALLATQKSLAKKQSTIDSLMKKNDALHAQYRQATKTTELGNKKEQDLTQQVSCLQQRINSLSNQHNSTIQTLETQHDTAIQALTEQLQKERNENKRLRQDQALHHESLTSQKHATREALLDNEALQSELVVLQSKLAALQQHPHNHSPAGQTPHTDVVDPGHKKKEGALPQPALSSASRTLAQDQSRNASPHSHNHDVLPVTCCSPAQDPKPHREATLIHHTDANNSLPEQSLSHIKSLHPSGSAQCINLHGQTLFADTIDSQSPATQYKQNTQAAEPSLMHTMANPSVVSTQTPTPPHRGENFVVNIHFSPDGEITFTPYTPSTQDDTANIPSFSHAPSHIQAHQETGSQSTLTVSSDSNSMSSEKKSPPSTTEEGGPSSFPHSIDEPSGPVPNGLDFIIQTVSNYLIHSQAGDEADHNHAHDQLRKRFLSKACRDFLSTSMIAQTQHYPLDFSYAPQTLREAKATVMQFFSFLQQLSAYHIPYQSGLFGSQAFFWLLNTFSPQSSSFTHRGDIDLYIQVQPDDYHITCQVIGQLVNMVASVSRLTCQFSQDSCITRHSKLACARYSLDIHIKKATRLPVRQRLHDFTIPYDAQKGLLSLPAQSLTPDKRRYLFGEPLEPSLDIFWPTLFRALCAWVEHARPMTECLGQATPVTQTLHHAINQVVQDSTRRQIFVRDIVSLIERYMETDSAMSLWRLVTMDLSCTTSLAGCLLQELMPDSQPTTFSETLYFSEHITPMALLPRVKLATLITYLVRHKHSGQKELPQTHITLLSGPFTLFAQHNKPVAPLDDATWPLINTLVGDWRNHLATPAPSMRV